MSKPSLVQDARGASRLAIHLTLLVTELVETMHHNIARRPGMLGQATLAPTKGITGLVYRSVRVVTRVVGGSIDAALAPIANRLQLASNWPGREPVVAALNGVLGDHLEATDNPLAIRMQLRVAGRPIGESAGEIAAAIPQARGRVVVMVHGLCMSDRQWERRSHDHGQALARDLGADTLYLRYNSGRAIHDNGAEFAMLLDHLVAHWPVRLTELVLVGHSMGGLVIRSACAAAAGGVSAWTHALRAIVFLGTPHFGSPLERIGHGVELILGASPYTAAFTALGRLRSAGIMDLRHGTIAASDEHPGGRRHPRPSPPLPAGVPCFAIAGSLSRTAPRNGRAPRGDGLVPVNSALGQHADPRMHLDFPNSRQRIALGTGHLDLLSSPAVRQRSCGSGCGKRAGPVIGQATHAGPVRPRTPSRRSSGSPCRPRRSRAARIRAVSALRESSMKNTTPAV